MQPLSNKKLAFVIGASSVGTLIEWYDFYIFGMLANIIAIQFFPENSGTSALLSTLAIFAAGFIVRPFGAIVFGRLGDKVGRKYTFLLTLVLMGGSTFAIGLVPSFSSIGWAAPILVLFLRLIQGLALGGEYGGAATYVAEHSPAHKRGFYTSFIQTTATLGLFLALGVIIVIRGSQGVEKFGAAWGGWRYPFWISAILVVVSILVRMKMQESPLFAQLKAEGKTSVNPLKESFAHKANFKMVLLALFGAVMGQGVIWYTGQFYAQNFLENVCKIEFIESRNIMLIAIALATPFFLFFGWLSDKVGRKWIMLLGMLLGVVSYRPMYNVFLQKSNPLQKQTEVNLAAGKIHPTKYHLNKDKTQILATTLIDTVYTDEAVFTYTKTDTIHLKEKLLNTSNKVAFALASNQNSSTIDTTYIDLKTTNLVKASSVQYVVGNRFSSGKAVILEKKLSEQNNWLFIFIVFAQILFVTMVYGPIAAFLVELFPTKIRYTSMSLPYHVGNGIFGGLVPFLSALIVEFTKSPTNVNGDPLAGLWYPISVAALCFVIGAVYLSNKKNEV